MNIIELQDNLKDFSDNVLMKEMQSPSGNMPQFLVLSELTRRRRMRDDYKRQEAANMPTVAEEVMTASGAPQEGLTAIARNMAPNSSIAQNTSADMAVQREPTRAPQMMADGGILEMNEGGGLSGLLQGIFGFGRGDEDIGKPVQPYPENSPNPRDRSTWMRMYGETHNLDGSPKSMSPNTAMTEMNQGIGNVSADVGDFTPTVPGAAQDPSTDLDIGNILAGSQKFGFDRIPNQDTTSGLPVAAPDFDATDEEDFLDAESERLDQLDVAAANMGDQPLPSVSQIDSEIDLDIFRQNLANSISNQPTAPNVSTEVAAQLKEDESRSPTIADYGLGTVGFRQPEDPNFQYPQGRIDDNYSNMIKMLEQEGIGPSTSTNFGEPTEGQKFDPNQRKLDMFDLMGQAAEERGGYQAAADAEANQAAIANLLRSTEDEMLNASGAMNASYPRSQESPMPLPDNLPDQSRFIPEMPIDSDSVMPPIMDADDAGGGSGGGAGSDSYSGFESRIAQMLADREKSAQSDKWLALAQAGMALMASDSPTLGGAIGEAGLVGISQMRDAKSQYDKEVLELLGTQADIDDARRGRDLESRELALERDQLEQTIASDKALSDYRMASLTPRGASISDLQAGLSYLNGEIQTQATIIGTDELGEQVEQIDMTKVDPQLLVQKKSLEDALLARINKSGTDFDATGS